MCAKEGRTGYEFTKEPKSPSAPLSRIVFTGRYYGHYTGGNTGIDGIHNREVDRIGLSRFFCVCWKAKHPL